MKRIDIHRRRLVTVIRIRRMEIRSSNDTTSARRGSKQMAKEKAERIGESYPRENREIRRNSSAVAMPEIHLIGIQLTEIGAVSLRTLS